MHNINHYLLMGWRQTIPSCTCSTAVASPYDSVCSKWTANYVPNLMNILTIFKVSQKIFCLTFLRRQCILFNSSVARRTLSSLINTRPIHTNQQVLAAISAHTNN